MTFNPNEIGIPNGNFFGFPYTLEESEIVILSVPWDATTSYGKGTSKASKAMIDASMQIDLFDFDVENASQIKVGTIPIFEKIEQKNIETNKISTSVQLLLEKGISQSDKKVVSKIEKVNNASNEINDYVFESSIQWLSKNKIVGLIGGEHSVPFGLINALCKKHKEFGILHIDAHADLRKAYNGFEHSHASIMNNVLKLKNIKKLVQVSIRDLCEDEINLAKSDSRIIMFDDYSVKSDLFKGISWDVKCDEIISNLPQKVYISFDIDGLQAEFCPSTGTPVPGGMSFEQAAYLLKKIIEHKKQIIGFDLCEVSPGETEWDANVGARVLQKLINYTHKSNL